MCQIIVSAFFLILTVRVKSIHKVVDIIHCPIFFRAVDVVMLEFMKFLEVFKKLITEVDERLATFEVVTNVSENGSWGAGNREYYFYIKRQI